jgi:hypothetical protein
MVTKKTWQEFRDIGMLWWINTTLHMFGWALVYDFDENGELIEVYPARVKFRGFGEKQVEVGYQKVSEYLKNNAEELYKESID